MNTEPIARIQDGVQVTSLDPLRNQDNEDEPQEYPQHSSRAEPSPSPWSSIADPNESWEPAYHDPFAFPELEAFNDGSEPKISTANHGYSDDDPSELRDLFHDIEENGHDHHESIPEHGALSPIPMDSQSAQNDVSMDTSDAPQQSSIKFTAYRQARERPTNPFEDIGAQFPPGSSTDLERLTNHLTGPPPRVVVSDISVDNVGDGMKRAVSELYAPFESKQKLGQNIHKSVTSNEVSSQIPIVDRYHPTNYEIAMHDKQPLYKMIGGIEPHIETLAAERVNTFCADADSITANIVAVSNTDGSLGVKRRRLSRDLSTLQIPTKTPPELHSWSGNTLTLSKSQNSLQVPTYPTPPSSRGIAEHNQLGGVWGNGPPSTPTTPSCASPKEFLPPISPSPSSLPDAADGINRCPYCPDRIFTGSDQKSNLRRHLRDNHDNMPRLSCLVPGCNVTFKPSRKDNRIKHVRAMHPDYPLPAPSTKRKRKADSDMELMLG